MRQERSLDGLKNYGPEWSFDRSLVFVAATLFLSILLFWFGIFFYAGGVEGLAVSKAVLGLSVFSVLVGWPIYGSLGVAGICLTLPVFILIRPRLIGQGVPVRLASAFCGAVVAFLSWCCVVIVWELGDIGSSTGLAILLVSGVPSACLVGALVYGR